MTDLDPLLREAMTRVRGPVDARPSLTDVRRRARRHNRKRIAVTAGVVACTGVATAALVIRRDGAGSSATGQVAPVDSGAPVSTQQIFGTTTTIDTSPQLIVEPWLVWTALLSASNDPAGVAFVTAPTEAAAQTMPTAAQFGCATEDCQGMFTYVIWHELARILGFSDVASMQMANPNIDFTLPPVEGDVLQTVYSGGILTATTSTTSAIDVTATTLSFFDGIVLIDGGAPAGAMEDAYQRLAGYNRTIVDGTGRSVEQTLLMPIGNNTTMASAVGSVLGLHGFDTWDPSFIASPIQGMVAVVVGPDYWDRVQQPATVLTTSTTTVDVTTTSAAP